MRVKPVFAAQYRHPQDGATLATLVAAAVTRAIALNEPPEQTAEFFRRVLSTPSPIREPETH
jgi:hypothetical protein